MDGKFTVSLDGQEAQMIIAALLEMANGMQTRQVAEMYQVLANRINEGKRTFHSFSYQIMAARYGLPNTLVSRERRLHMPYIPNPSKPGEVSKLQEAVDELLLCRTQGSGWNLTKLDKWLYRFPIQMAEAVKVLDEILDEHYPPVEAGA
jgi:hypothetical protein